MFSHILAVVAEKLFRQDFWDRQIGSTVIQWETKGFQHSDSVGDQRVSGSSLTSITALCP